LGLALPAGLFPTIKLSNNKSDDEDDVIPTVYMNFENLVTSRPTSTAQWLLWRENMCIRIVVAEDLFQTLNKFHEDCNHTSPEAVQATAEHPGYDITTPP
jgi:hypothetical protein